MADKSEPLELRDAVWPFQSWDPEPDRSGPGLGDIRCCDQVLAERAGAIACDHCRSVIERRGAGWQVVRVKGRPASRLTMVAGAPPEVDCEDD